MFEVENSESYPGWNAEPISDILRKLQSVHEQVFGHPARLIAMHAELEYGVVGEKYPGVQMASFGPAIVDPHSPNERVGYPRSGILEVYEGGPGKRANHICR